MGCRPGGGVAGWSPCCDVPVVGALLGAAPCVSGLTRTEAHDQALGWDPTRVCSATDGVAVCPQRASWAGARRLRPVQVQHAKGYRPPSIQRSRAHAPVRALVRALPSPLQDLVLGCDAFSLLHLCPLPIPLPKGRVRGHHLVPVRHQVGAPQQRGRGPQAHVQVGQYDTVMLRVLLLMSVV